MINLINRKIVFFDIDGTLLSETTKSIPQSTKTAISTLRKNGHLAFINTGRPVFEITPMIKEVGFDGFVCGCGTYIEYNDEILLHKSLGKNLSKEIAKDMKIFDFEAILEGRYDIYWDKHENIKDETMLSILDQHKREGFFSESTWYKDDIEFDKLVIFLKENSNFEGFYNKYNDKLEFIKRDQNFYEIIPAGYSKASGIEFLTDKLNIPYENTFAIGDSTNDLSMLDHVKNSIAMGNSAPSLFDRVSFVTKDVDDNGIYHALNHYGLI